MPGGVDARLVRDQADPFAGEERIIVARQHVDPELDRALRRSRAQSQNAASLTIHFLFRLPRIDS